MQQSDPLPIAVFISGYGSNLQAIIDAIETSKLKANITVVISDKADSYGLERAKKHGIPNLYIDPVKHPNQVAYSQAIIENLQPFAPKLIVLAGFMRVLSSQLVKSYRGQIINIHPSLLPKYRGLNTYKRALTAGDKEHGTSVHFVTEQLDGGPIIAQERVPIAANATEQSLIELVQSIEYQLYPKVIQWIAEGRLGMKGNAAYLDGKKLDYP